MKRPAVYIGLAVVVLAAALVVILPNKNDSQNLGGQSAQSNPGSRRDATNLLRVTLPDYNGRQVNLAGLLNKGPVVVNSWATWCPFCTAELPAFAKAQQEFKDDLTIVAIDRAESLSTAKGFSDQLGISNQLTFLLDSGDSFYKSLGGFAMPETIFVSRSGKLVEHKRGPLTESQLRQKIADLIKEP
ncbi:TlpA family protein disulfide reductase [Candidatus Saccharibacteria bacterium]|nr:TlpA family protein disulfide reductase [Candidatus Saccharibacteria bacterium]